jgi:succinoglycan biosynthesis protein ExoA
LATTAAQARVLSRAHSLKTAATEPIAQIATDKVLVVIPCLNEERNIAAVIRNVLRDPAAENLLVVVADGGSSDGTRKIVSAIAARVRNLKLMDNPQRLQSAGINLAARLYGSGRRWLIRMDAHADYPDGFVSCLIDEARRTGAPSVVVAMHSRGTGFFQEAAAIAQNSVLGTGGSAHRLPGAAQYVDHGHHALFDLERFLAIEGYDETLSHNEDAEFDLRLAESGGRIWLTRATEVTYHPRARARDLFKQYRNYGRGRATTILRHRARPKLRQLAPAAVAPAAVLALLSPLAIIAILPLLMWLLTCLSYGTVLGVRQGRGCAYASGIAAAIMHFAWSLGFWTTLSKHAASRIQPTGAIPAAGGRA